MTINKEKDAVNKRTRLVFAYGSDMDFNQIKSRCSKPSIVTIGYLPDYELAFFGYTPVWDGAMETFVMCKGKTLWGVLYEIPFHDCDDLDYWYDARFDGTGNYFHFPCTIYDVSGNPYYAYLYKKDINGIPQKPSTPYRDMIVNAASFHKLPPYYICHLENIDSKPVSYNVPKNPNSPFSFGTHSHSCESCSPE
ncbi:MAG TPA: gamma-glutamylcyclotransferase family protein [Chitinispirillaceae bacterium]|nr:gamma-glutamylcyclotransferase family protein [Chitinispirillaceae bacterium]